MKPDRSNRRSTVTPTSRTDAAQMHPHDTHELTGHPVDLPAADLVGWATGSRLHDEPADPTRARDLLATALGVRPGNLSGMDDATVETALGRIRGLVQHLQDLTAEVAVDELTGALRRGAGLDALQREIDRHRRVGGKGVVLAFIDVDGLKQVNDTQGHAAGDELLHGVARVLHERLRSYDLVIRWGGDEFIVVLSNATTGEAERTLHDLVEGVRRRTGGSISTGLAELEPQDTALSLVARADTALYAGRDERRAAVRR